MEAVDRLGWADGLVFDAHTARLGVRVSDARYLARVRALLPPGAREVADDDRVTGMYSLLVGGPGARPGLRRFNILYSAAERVARSMDLEEVLGALAHELHFGVALCARERVFVHAGVVGWRGRAIVLPGRSHAGKSSLVAALVRAGAAYYSDEYAVLDAEGTLHPYAKALSLRARAGERGSPVEVAALGGRAGDAPLRVGLVVSTHYREGARWRPRPVTPAQAMLSLLDNTVVARLRPPLVKATLRTALVGVHALQGARGEADAAARAILRRASALADASWEPAAAG
jgi:hypothetical protein